MTEHPLDAWRILTVRELQVACLLAVGRERHDIANQMRITVKTVDHYRIQVLRKMKTRNNVALARRAIRDGLVSPDHDAEVNEAAIAERIAAEEQS
jgi:DNA-binding NarL/FixJ family response regulator